MKSCNTRQQRIFIVIGPLALAGIALSACTSSGANAVTAAPACGSTAPKLTVQASGTATTTPNLLTLDIGVDVTDPTASTALSDANTKGAALSNSLQLAGVSKADIQTTNFTIQPNIASNGTVTGYEVMNTVVAKLRNLSASGAVIDAAARSAGNAIRLNGIMFTVDTSTTTDDTARSAAIGIAAARAHSMATAAKESISGVCSITDSLANNVPFMYGLSGAGITQPAASGTNGSLEVPLQPGTLQTNAQVTVVYALEGAK